MKELSIEEKAKAYDESLAKAKELYSQHCAEWRDEDIEYIFPELKESEDEKIRKALIDGFTVMKESKNCGKTFSNHNIPVSDIIAWLEKQGEPIDKGEISDGYHTFNELYYYRMLYNAAFFNMLPKEWVHKSKKHHDGEECFGGGWFIVTANLPTGQISNHYELKDWDLFRIPEKEVADKWDGHTPQEAADRLYKYLLEKQAGQNQTDKVKPKFKVGDWIINPRTGLIKHIKNVLLCDNNGNYEFESSSMSIDSVDNSFHLWTIQDAKDGDVLYINNTVSESIMIYKSFNNGLIKKYASYNKFGFEGEHYLTLNDGYITPATKEQCTELFLKMYEAGYEWDVEKKELKKIDQNSTWSEEDEKRIFRIKLSLQKDMMAHKNSRCDIADLQDCEDWLMNLYESHRVQPKQEWNEEDKSKVQRICKYLNEAKKYYADITEVRECIEWLKSLQDKVQPKQEWSEEDEVKINRIVACLENLIVADNDILLKDVEWLKSLQSRVQLKQEWSDVDKDMLFRIIDDLKFLKDIISIDPKYAVNITDMEREITWLESLRPQNKWKPSDEQMEALDWQVENTSVSSWQYKATKELMEDLKKLKEE